MKLTCKNCDKELNIPDSKVPADKTFTVKCPGCQGKISSKPEVQAAKKEEVKAEKEMTPIDLEVKMQESIEGFLEEFEPGELTALVCDTNNMESIDTALKELGYRTSMGESAVVAVGKIKFNQYSLILINERFDNFTLENNPVLLHVQPMPMATRRNVIIVLIGDNLKTNDHMAAFARSVNLVVNNKDINNLANLIKRTIQEHERFYKIFKEALEAEGKI